MKNTPRFFCDNCGYEVSHEVKSCPNCGRFFASVRCPSCGFTGGERMFLNGCPSCGYSAPPPKPEKRKRRSREKRKRVPAEPLPSWAYIIAVLVLIACVFLFSHLLTM